MNVTVNIFGLPVVQKSELDESCDIREVGEEGMMREDQKMIQLQRVFAHKNMGIVKIK